MPTAWTGSTEIASYVGVEAADAARLAAFLAVFADDAPLGASDAWQSPGDEDLYWPAALR